MTLGFSPKAVFAFVFPITAAVGAAVASWIVTGDFSATEIRTAASGVILAAVSGAGAWIAKPGEVSTQIGVPSDELNAGIFSTQGLPQA